MTKTTDDNKENVPVGDIEVAQSGVIATLTNQCGESTQARCELPKDTSLSQMTTKTTDDNKENVPVGEIEVAQSGVIETLTNQCGESTQALCELPKDTSLSQREASSDIALPEQARCVSAGSVVATLSRQEKKRMNNKFYCRLYRARRKVKKLANKKVIATSGDHLVASDLPQSIKAFLLQQVKLAGMKKKARRYTKEQTVMALALYYQSPKAYRHLQKNFILPSPRLLRRKLQHIQLQTGLHPSILATLQERFANSSRLDKLVILSFDEMAIKPRLVYSSTDDKVEGFEDVGEMGRTERVATQALVLMVRGLAKKWKLPIGYYLNSGPAPARVLKSVLTVAVRQLRQAGLEVVATVCDMGKPNQDLYRQLGVTEENPQFAVDGMPVVALHDVPHIMKCVRNGLLKHDVEVDGEVLSWSHIKAFYDADKGRPIRAAPKLGPGHLNPETFKKMSVKLATQVMSGTTAAGMLLYHSVGKFVFCCYLQQNPLALTHTWGDAILRQSYEEAWFLHSVLSNISTQGLQMESFCELWLLSFDRVLNIMSGRRQCSFSLLWIFPLLFRHLFSFFRHLFSTKIDFFLILANFSFSSSDNFLGLGSK